MKICLKCVLPETFPTINFDGNGICNYCRSYKGEKHQEELKNEYREKFAKLAGEYKGKSDYDVLMAYSGGKDSTYTLDIFKNRFKLRVLALTFDNGFVSPHAMENMKVVTDRLGIDHVIFKPGFDLLRKVFLVSVNGNLYSKKTLERASTICTSCMSFVKFVSLKTALEKRIPFIGYGWSPGQAPIQSSVMKTSAGFVRGTQKAIFDPLYAKLGDDIRPYFLNDGYFEASDRFPYNVHPLAFVDYDEEKIFGRIGELGWKPPTDTDPNSTNCLMNAFANETHIKQFEFHPYAFELAGLVRMGVMSREVALKRLNEPSNEAVIAEVKKKLGILDEPHSA
jgi:3'-phosphoadenosine 5'-phosphosulfate sulfotransferase (PAPS reductase)/FAD synthetase